MKVDDIAVGRIKEFTDLVSAGMEAWVKAGQLLNQIIEDDPDARRKITLKTPWLTTGVLQSFERIGRREIYPQLMLDQSIGARHLIRLPYAEQERLFAAEVEVAITRNGEIITEKKKLQNLTRKEAETAFTDTGLRPIKEQREMLRPKMTDRENARRPERESEEIPEQAESVVDEDSISAQLGDAQARLIRTRELLVLKKSPSALDRFITIALNAIGNLRFELNER